MGEGTCIWPYEAHVKVNKLLDWHCVVHDHISAYKMLKHLLALTVSTLNAM